MEAPENIATLACSLESIESNEPLLGTAPRADVVFALEYPGRWSKKAFEETTLSDEIKQQINAQLKLIPNSKLLLIKQRPRSEGHIKFFAALPSADPPVLYRFSLADYDDLLSLSLVNIAKQDHIYTSAISQDPVFFVCTNGLRDQCCALHGAAAFATLSREFGDMVWESTHHGGHRFAANLLAMPAGLSFGRLRADSAVAIVEDALAGTINVDHFRGRIAYEEPIQAAEILLRKEFGLEGMDALQLTSSNETGSNRWQAKFADASGNIHHALVEQNEGPEQIHLSCGDSKTSPIVHFRLVESSKL